MQAISLLLLVWCSGALYLAFAQGQCSSLVSEEWSAYLTCSKVPSAINNCTGLSCSNSDLNWTASLVVQPCTDPVVVVVNVTVAEGTRAVGFVFTELEEQQQDGVVVDMGRYRNASHIFVEAQTNITQSNELIPPVYIPLNPSVCMCQSVQSMADNAAIDCNPVNCTGLRCTFTYILQTFQVNVNILQCNTPVAIVVQISRADNGELYFDHTFTHSEVIRNIQVPGVIIPIDLNVVLIEREYSVTVGASVIVANTGYTLFPTQQVILDKTECATTSTESPGQTGSPYTNDTCSQLNEIASSIHVITCTRKDGCTGLTCSGLGYRTELTLLPCVTPPGFNVEVYRDTDDMLVYTANITSGTTEYIAPHGIVISVMVQQSPAGFTVKVDVIRPIHIPILGTTEIPLDRCQCSPVPVDVDQCQCSPIPVGVVCGTPASLFTTAHLPSTSSFSPGHSLFSAPSRTPPSPSPLLQSSPGRGLPLQTVLAISFPIGIIVVIGVAITATITLILTYYIIFRRHRTNKVFEVKFSELKNSVDNVE